MKKKLFSEILEIQARFQNIERRLPKTSKMLKFIRERERNQLIEQYNKEKPLLDALLNTSDKDEEAIEKMDMLWSLCFQIERRIQELDKLL